MKVAVIIPSLANEVSRPYLRLCVESLRATTDWDIIVVTNGTKTPEPLNIDGITVRLHTSDQGQCVATNIGAQVVAPDADYIMVCNDDMYFAPSWNKYLTFEHLVFSPNLVEPANNAGSAPPFLKADGGLTVEEFDKELVDTAVEHLVEHKTEPGFNLPFFIRKDVWQTIGGYDEAYDPWGSNSDTDLQTMVNLAGITPMRLRDVLVYHFSNKSGTFDGTHQDFYQNNWEYFDSKWGFNRDQLKSDVWMNKKILPDDANRIKFDPPWRGKYG
jgi:glycosyltransferase involved in cell wall biosynthesis